MAGGPYFTPIKCENAQISLELGDRNWYKKPDNSGEKLNGPGLVNIREWENSYVIEIKPGGDMKAHQSFLKLYREPVVQGRGFSLYYFRRTGKEEVAMPDEWNVEKIFHRKKIGNGSF